MLATSEAWIGCLDGLNSKGLAVALTFGGRLAHGREGFQTPLLLRYALETCSTITEAIKTLERLPAQTVSNVVLLDRSGDYAVAFLSPDRPMVVRKRAVTTNHQLALEWPEGNSWSETAERADLLDRLRATTPDLRHSSAHSTSYRYIELLTVKGWAHLHCDDPASVWSGRVFLAPRKSVETQDRKFLGGRERITDQELLTSSIHALKAKGPHVSPALGFSSTLGDGRLIC